ncbi:bile acid:sodium symporter family protein [Streptomyces flavofungini]|uniref:bile acid:sodium symporter family protein n=1 Tax=Streptomyces flavofungini TaxID=68200 RepID=UPI0025B24C9A|nr:bile acid:sodium symporter family protein [Streptomyces flavofungini]WJV50512.1 bile acid:sodium symporter family protein [Streptomyces flavofungini]
MDIPIRLLEPVPVDSSLTTFLLPAVLAVIMFGLGLGLTVADFRRVTAHPRPVAVALCCQLVLLPAACLGLVLAFDLSPALAVGMMLLAASPGGTMANIFSHLFGGDVALNVTLTAINSVIAVFTLPLVVNLSLDHFMSGTDEALGLRFEKTLQVFLVVLVPVAAGMLVRQRRPDFAERSTQAVKVTAVGALVAVIIAAVVSERENVLGYLADVGLVAFLFAAISLTIGYGATRLARGDHRQSVATCFEIGMHNTTLSMAIALSPSLLDSTRMAIPSAVYAVEMFVMALAAGFLLRRIAPHETATATTGALPA